MSSSIKDRYDAFILKAFKYIVVALALFSFVLLLTYFRDSPTLGHLLYCICCSYAAGFVLLGIPSVAFRRTSQFSRWKIVLFVSVMCLVASAALWIVFGRSDTTPNIFITGFFRILVWTVDDVSFLSVTGGVFVIMIMTTLATYGVLEVLTALLGRDYHRVMLSLQKKDSRLKRSASKTFMVPDIIDVNDVVLKPRPVEGFDMDVFRVLYKYIFIVGVVVSSYLFLNPVFLKAIPLQDMMVITFLLSLFVVVLVIPVSITHSLGAEALSAGNRPYVLWKGMKDKMFRWGFYLALFLTLLWVCLFTGEDMARILISYVGYMVFVILMAVLVSFIYVNSFRPDLQDTISKNFEDAKSKL